MGREAINGTKVEVYLSDRKTHQQRSTEAVASEVEPTLERWALSGEAQVSLSFIGLGAGQPLGRVMEHPYIYLSAWDNPL